MTDDPAPSRAPATELELRFRAVLAHLPPAEFRVADLVRRDPVRVAQLTVTELAEQASTSAATVVRAAKSLGFEGYPQLRFALATQAGQGAPGLDQEIPVVADIVDADDVAAMLAKLARFESSQLHATAALASAAALETVATRVAESRRCCLFGVGASGLVAQDLGQKLTRIGLPVWVHAEQDAAVAAASLLGQDDVALAVSHAGETPGAYEPIRRASAAGAFTAAITADPRSTLARLVDEIMLTSGAEFGLRSAAVGSRTSQLLLVDTIFVRVAQLTPRAASALQETYDAISATRGRSR
ncbi:MAG TPA: MurR/RpiR family transcriptional regulator [Propionibacteriaceae bacterium]